MFETGGGREAKGGVLKGEGFLGQESLRRPTGVSEGEGPWGPRRGGGGGSSPTKERVLGAESGGALKREGLQGPGCGEKGVRSGRTRTDGPVLTEGLQAEEALAGSRGVSSREAAASCSEPTSPARPPDPFPSGPLLRASLPIDFPAKGRVCPGVLSATPAPPCPRAGPSPPGPLPRVRTRAAARSPRRRTPSPERTSSPDRPSPPQTCRANPRRMRNTVCACALRDGPRAAQKTRAASG